MPSSKNLPAEHAATVADLIATVELEPRLSKSLRNATLVGLRLLCRLLGRTPGDMPASTDAIRNELHHLYPEVIGYSPRTLTNMKSAFLRALRIAGLNHLPPTHSIRPSPAWERYLGPIDIQAQRILSRFARYCTAFGIEPEQVTQASVDDFGRRLRQGSLIKDPHHSVVKVCWIWNRLRGTVPHWPDVELLAPRRGLPLVNLGWASLPESLRDETERFVDRLASGKPFYRRQKPRKRSAGTLRHYRDKISKVASWAILAGVEPDRLQSLEGLTRPDTVIAAFNYYHRVSGDSARGYMARIITHLRFIAKHWVQADEETLRKLAILHTRIGRQRPEMTPRTRALLRQLEAPDRLKSLLTLPGLLLDRAVGRIGPRKPWTSAQLAAATAIILAAPVSARKLCLMRRNEHLRRGTDGRMIAVVPDKRDARGRELQYALPPYASRILDAYLASFYPGSDDCPWVFPNRYGGRKSGNMMSLQIRREVRIMTGVDMSTRDFQHFVAKLYLTRNPGEFDVVRRLLGQRSINSTLTYYREFSESLSPTALDDIVMAGKG